MLFSTGFNYPKFFARLGCLCLVIILACVLNLTNKIDMAKAYYKIINRTDPNRYNCVYFARAKVPSIPYGMWTICNKVKIINSYKPRVGSVAIIKTSRRWGHLAVVTYAKGRHITIIESNYKSCTITERHNTPANLEILGYFDPRK